MPAHYRLLAIHWASQECLLRARRCSLRYSAASSRPPSHSMRGCAPRAASREAVLPRHGILQPAGNLPAPVKILDNACGISGVTQLRIAPSGHRLKKA